MHALLVKVAAPGPWSKSADTDQLGKYGPGETQGNCPEVGGEIIWASFLMRVGQGWWEDFGGQRRKGREF